MSLLVYCVTQSASALCIELLMFCPTQQTHTVCNREYCGGIGATWEIKLHSRQQIPSGRVWIPTDAVATREVTPGHFCHHLRIFKDSKVITTVHFLHHIWNQDIIQDVYEFELLWIWRKNEMILCIVFFLFLTPLPSPSWLSLWKMTRVRGLVSMRGTGRPSVHKLGERGTDQEMMKGIKTSARDKTACPKSLDGVAMKFYCKNSPNAFKSPPQSVLKL